MATIDPSQIEAMKQPFIDSLFNILDTCRQRHINDEQTGKQTKTTSVWHPIIGHIRGRTSAMTVFVYLINYLSSKNEFISYLFRSNQETVQRVIVQYKYLWSKSFVNMLFESIPSGNPAATPASSSVTKKETSKSCFSSIRFKYFVILRRYHSSEIREIIRFENDD